MQEGKLTSSEMTNSDVTERVGQRTPDKRTRLVEGARLVLHQQGVEKTTLADIAGAADVPVGNVYYYFKTKDDLVRAVIDSHGRDIESILASLDRHRTPKARLKALVCALAEHSRLAPRAGLPRGRRRACSAGPRSSWPMSSACRRPGPWRWRARASSTA